MKVLFMGTPDFAVSTLEAIIDQGHELVGVVTQPDKVKGRGAKISFPAVKETALKYNLPVYQPIKVKEPEFIETVRNLKPEVIVVAAFGQILPKELLDIPPYGCINVHASLLPKYRGAAPIQAAILNGDEETGVTIMHMDVKLDTGDMILQEKIPISQDETGGSLHDKLAKLGADLLVKVLEQLRDGTTKRVPQDDSEATYVGMLNKEMGLIDFSQPAIKIERMIRGLNPWPSAYTKLNGKTLKLWEAQVIEYSSDALYGQVVAVNKDSFVVMTGKDALLIRELQLEGKKRLSCEAFLRGYPIEVGTILG
ncbi:methionyl-tRNA formyltransferase [Herbinix luporum]|jgi:methionyl-tRNA formyltransferase|uniref:Methionyl-tRNA formyltransferase n=1 Tax=Herbinix luporum TaxID=1679721 RepID=A0A0K8J4S5_9FIRM|nr:methionyl-tRNA formyltransferase [Herbinix luporum]MDI9489284.1 methionyl-tRNA formyltransferase [Bacillota bacterium]CUH92349.1 Methionyl-tRNA formyltransferase [Herbinix luporum]HHT58017.1 methionyl-tRNA formyltransferase [Herbinix luporum]